MASRFRRYARRGLYLFGGLALLGSVTLFVGPLRRMTWEPAAKAAIERGLGSVLGGTSTVGRLAWVDGALELEQLSWRAADGPGKIELERARVQCALGELARLKLEGIRRVELNGLDVVWVVEPGEDTESKVREAGPPAPFGLTLPPIPEIEASDVAIDLRGSDWQAVLADLEATVEGVADSREVSVHAPNLRVTSAAKSILDGPLDLEGSLSDVLWDVDRLSVGDDLLLEAELRAKRAGGFAAVATASLQPAELDLDVDWTDDELAGGLTLAPLDLATLPASFGVPEGLAGKLDLEADWDWGAGRPWRQATIEVSAGVVGGSMGSTSFPRVALTLGAKRGVWTAAIAGAEITPREGLPELVVDAAFSWAEDDVRLERANISTDGGTRLVAEGHVPFVLGEGVPDAETPLALTIDGSVDELSEWPVAQLSGKGRIKARVEGTFGAPTTELEVDVEDAQWGAYPAGIVKLRARAARVVELESLRVELPEFATADASGQWDLPSSLADWTGDAPPDWRTVPIAAEFSLEAPELARLSLKNETLRRLSGRLDAGGTVSGSISDLDYRGTGSLESARLDFLGELPSLTEMSLKLEAEPGHVRIVEGTGATGGAPFTLTGEYDDSVSPAKLHAELNGKNLLFSRSRDALLRGDVDIEVDGPVERLTVTGNLNVTSGVLASRIEVLELLEEGSPSIAEEGLSLFSLTTAPLSAMRFDVAVSCARPIAIENNVVTARVRPDVRLKGTGEVPELIGTIYVDAAAISLPASTLRVRRGTVRFDPSDPFVPDLSLEAGTKRLGYDVSVAVTGPYDNPEVALSSIPPLANEDILVLLLTGQLPADSGSRAGRSQAGQTVALYFGKDLLAKWFASDDPLSDEESFFERFDFVTGQEISRQGVPTIEASFRMRQDLWEEDDRLLLTLERDVWEDYNLGVRWVVRLK